MALRNLVAQKAKLTEEAIENIIADYVRYDIEELEIVFTPDAAGLSNKAKVLIFLVAQQGWQFVLDEAIDVEVAPARMEELLGIQGGSLRPILKDLKDRNLLASKSGNYSVRSTSLDAIRAELDGQGGSAPRANKKPAKRSTAKSENDGAEGATARRASRPGQGPGDAFNQIIADGYFDDGRTLAQLQARLHERAIIIKQTSLPKYLLGAVRDGRLTREKKEVSGKQVWVYTTAK